MNFENCYSLNFLQVIDDFDNFFYNMSDLFIVFLDVLFEYY